MTNTPFAKHPGTVATLGAVKKLAAAAAIAGALGLAGLGMAGIASAAPAHDSGAAHSTSSSEDHAGSVSAPHVESSAPHAESSAPHAESSAPHAESTAPHAESSAPHADAAAPTGDDVVHAHLIPGVKLVPPAADAPQTAHPTLDSTSNPNEIGMVYPSGSIYPNPPDYDPNCGPACYEVIDE